MTKRRKTMAGAHPALFGCLCLALLVGGAVGQDCYAGQEKAVAQLREPAVSDEVLGQLRGGFIDKTGFMVNFGFDEVVKIDGIVKARTVMKMSNVDMSTLKMLADKSESAGGDGPNFTFRQSAAEDHGASVQSVVQSSMGNGLTALVIQNMGDNKVIEHAKTLDLAISAYPSLKNLRMNTTIKARLVEALR